jgi:hypothetical protein
MEEYARKLDATVALQVRELRAARDIDSTARGMEPRHLMSLMEWTETISSVAHARRRIGDETRRATMGPGA